MQKKGEAKVLEGTRVKHPHQLMVRVKEEQHCRCIAEHIIEDKFIVIRGNQLECSNPPKTVFYLLLLFLFNYDKCGFGLIVKSVFHEMNRLPSLIFF